MKKNNKIIKVPNILLNLAFISMLIVMTISVSKYKTTAIGNSETRVAKYVLGISSDSSINIPLKSALPNSSQELYFVLTNEDEKSNKNEVSLKYTIELENSANLPLEFKLYKYNETATEYEEIKLNSNVSDEFYINAGEKINNKYKTEIKWKENTQNIEYDSYKYSKTIDYVKITVNVVQMD